MYYRFPEDGMENHKPPKFKPDPKLKLMDQVRQVLRYHHYAYRTEQSYCDWILRYIKFHGGNTHPSKMGKQEIEAFLSHLATSLNVSAATQRQALNAIVFLYRRVLDQPVADQLEPVRAKRRAQPAGRHDQSRSATGSRTTPGHPPAHGENALRLRAQADGVRAAEGSGHRFRPKPALCSRGQGRQGPHNRPGQSLADRTQAPHRKSQASARRRSRQRVWRSF